MTDLEIIEKLAKEFFGWRWVPKQELFGAHHFGGETGTAWYPLENGHIGLVGKINIPDFDPLHDPVACALIKAEVRRRKWTLHIAIRSVAKVTIYDDNLQPLAFQEADTEERTVCLAALATCEATE